MLSWVRQMRASFGISFLWLIVLIYFTQGFRTLVWMAVSFQLKDTLKLSPSASQFLLSVANSPWTIKPLYGILSDCIPIQGRRRLPYLILATLLSLFPWVIVGLLDQVRSSSSAFTMVLTIQSIGSAMADVVIDAMIAESVRFERAPYAGDLQLISWSAMAFGGISGSLLGGYSLANLKVHNIFILFSVVPFIQLLSCSLVEEASLISSHTFHEDAPKKVKLVDGDCFSSLPNEESPKLLDEIDTGLDQIDRHSKLDTSLVSTDLGVMRRKKMNKNDESRNTIMQPEVVKPPKPPRWLLSLKLGFYDLSQAFRKPMILRPMTWFFLVHITIPNISTSMFYYQSEFLHLAPSFLGTVRVVGPMTWFFLAHITIPNISTSMFYYQSEFLHLAPSFLGTVRVVGWGGLMLGSFIYSRFLKHIKLRRILMWTQIGLAFLNLIDIVLVSRLNTLVGIPDKVMVLGGSALADAVHQFKLMPFLIISGRLCPPGIEGTLFALFMSINNLGATLSSFLGAVLASALHIQSEAFDNLLLGNLIRLICSFIPIVFLFLIPKEATGAS